MTLLRLGTLVGAVGRRTDMELFFNLKQLLKSELDETLYLPLYLRLLAFFTVPFDYSNKGRSYRSARSYFAQVQF